MVHIIARICVTSTGLYGLNVLIYGQYLFCEVFSQKNDFQKFNFIGLSIKNYLDKQCGFTGLESSHLSNDSIVKPQA